MSQGCVIGSYFTHINRRIENTMKLLVVEDNESILLGLEFLLKEEGYESVTARSYQEALEACRSSCFDLALLDVGLPDGDGFELCHELKERQEVPVIFLTAREEEQDVVQGFDVGADDYIQKPFRNRELISRIQNVLRRCGKSSKVLQNRFLRLDTETKTAYSHGEPIVLTKLEYQILSIMLSQPGRLFTRDEILAAIWDNAGNFVNDNTLSVAMKRLREKIGDKDGEIIKTVRGMGYRIEREA